MSEGTDTEQADTATLPSDVLEEAERLTRLARDAVDDNERAAYRERRRQHLSEYDFTARVRTEDNGDVLVCHPAAWHDSEAGVIRTDRIEDLSRAEEVPLDAAGEFGDWESVEKQNRAVVKEVREHHGDVHGDNAAAFADFMGNHYARPVETATDGEIEEFCTEYFVRNAWPTAQQQAAVRESIDVVLASAQKITDASQ